MMKLNDAPLHRRIMVILAAVVLLPCLILSLFLYQYFMVRENADISKRYEALLGAMEISVNRNLTHVESVVDVLCDSSSIKMALSPHANKSDAVISLLFYAVEDIERSQAYLGAYEANILLLSPDENILERNTALLKQSRFGNDGALKHFLESNERRFWSSPRPIAYELTTDRQEEKPVISYYQKVFVGLSTDIGTVRCSLDINTLFSPAPEIPGNEWVKVWLDDACIFMQQGEAVIINPTVQETALPKGHRRISGNTSGYPYVLTIDVPESEFQDSSRRIFGVVFALLIVFYLLMVFITNYLVRAVLDKLTFVVHMMAAIDLNKRNLQIPEIGGSDVGLLVHSINKLLSKIDAQYDELLEQEKDKRKFQRSALQFQMNPHFLFNALHWLQLKLDEAGAAPSLRNAVGQLGGIYRYNLSPRDNATLSEEIDHMTAYVQLMRKLKDCDILLDVDCPEKLLTFILPRFTLQPIVENSIKYGLVRGVPLHIRIQIRLEHGGKKMVVGVENDGKPMPAERLSKMQSYINQEHKNMDGHIGLHNLMRRLRLTYGPQADVTLKIGTSGTMTILNIPYSGGWSRYEDFTGGR